ncbi:AfsR/SARP family transcriptional regulator, partial [Streptomyces sp. WAC06614]|uniref:AfsR/SARP family transcriptional regulator n=1 Tax=Streptomyces sp. WAC06614 TaxID=2487416 RepID=UPI0021B07638
MNRAKSPNPTPPHAPSTARGAIGTTARGPATGAAASLGPATGMEFTLLGPVSARRAGRPVALDGAKQRTVLAALLLARGHVVTDERLTTLLWGEDPPATSTSQLYTYVSRLRTRLGPDHGLERRGAGYAMRTADTTLVDWHTFQTLAAAGRTALREGRPTDAERRLAEALDLWQGHPLADVTDHLGAAETPAMTEAHLTAVELHAEAALALGQHAALVPGLTRQVALHPLREGLLAHLMTALYRSGRPSDALTAYEAARRLVRGQGVGRAAAAV